MLTDTNAWDGCVVTRLPAKLLDESNESDRVKRIINRRRSARFRAFPQTFFARVTAQDAHQSEHVDDDRTHYSSPLSGIRSDRVSTPARKSIIRRATV